MNILVTGANGFIGSNIIELLSNNSNFNFFKCTRTTVNLYSADNIKKYKLSDIENIINQLSSYKVDTIIENKSLGFNYTGNGKLLNSLNLGLKDLEFAIKDCYHKML